MKHFYALLSIIFIAIEGLAAPYANIPEHLYIIGYVDSEETMEAGSENYIGIEMIKEGNVFTATNVGLHPMFKGENSSQILIVTMNGESFTSDYSFELANSKLFDFTDNKDAFVDEPLKRVNAGSFPNLISIRPIGNYDISINFDEEIPTMSVKPYEEGISTDINNITTTNIWPIEYYTLQGMRVNKPTTGLYICKQGSRVSKVMIR